MSRLPILPSLAMAALLATGAAVFAQEQPAPPKAYLPNASERADLDRKKGELGHKIAELRSQKLSEERLADATVFLHTAELADQLYLYTKASEVRTALRGLDQGLERCDALAKGEAPWRSRPGSALRGYVSRIDDSVQPYRVVLPAGFDPQQTYRLDVVLHGRGPTELTFLEGNGSSRTPTGVAGEPFIELYPFGRGNNAFRWAGETDVFEALAAVRAEYKIDPNRVILRGFSMGGHGAWQLGLHYPGEWAGVSPGAGFTETRNYLGLGNDIPEYQGRAWHLYDAVDYAYNLFGTPFVGYGGEEDKQLQASLNMKAAAEREGAPMELVIGPKTGHSYHPDSFRKIMSLLAAAPRDPHPRHVRFATWNLKWNRRAWVTIDGMNEEYRRALVDADATQSPAKVRTENVSALSLNLAEVGTHKVIVDGEAFDAPAGQPLRLERTGNRWRLARAASGELRKRHGLQGPIDDAFTERFLVVRGRGEAWSPALKSYAEAELERFRQVWRFGFRSELPVKDDAAVTEADWRNANLVLLGDPGSNRLLAQVLSKLPLQWTRSGLKVAGKEYGPDAVPVLIFPNPLNPQRYVVINSGHTFTLRDLHRSNAYQTPKLGDWAVLKPGASGNEVLAAGFFNKRWQFAPDNSEPK